MDALWLAMILFVKTWFFQNFRILYSNIYYVKLDQHPNSLCILLAVNRSDVMRRVSVCDLYYGRELECVSVWVYVLHQCYFFWCAHPGSMCTVHHMFFKFSKFLIVAMSFATQKIYSHRVVSMATAKIYFRWSYCSKSYCTNQLI